MVSAKKLFGIELFPDEKSGEKSGEKRSEQCCAKTGEKVCEKTDEAKDRVETVRGPGEWKAPAPASQ